MRDLYNNKVYLLNLIIIVLAWSASSSCFYIIGFYVKYLPGDAFMNIIVTSVADAISSIVAGSISTAIGAKNTLFMSFSLATIGAIALMFSGDEKYLIVCFVMITRFGINSAFTLCYIITADYFPAIVTSRVFGICNVFSRFATILSPMIAELEPPIPMIIYSIVCTITMISSLGLTKSEEITEAIKGIDDSISYHSQFTAGSFVTKKEKIQLEKGIEINDDNTNFLDTGLNAEDDFFVASPKFDAD